MPGLVLVTGPNGAGKTNLLEALHFGSQGFSPRTRSEAQLVRFGEREARVRLTGTAGGGEWESEVDLVPREGKRARLNGAALQSSEELRGRLAALVFTPDRLAVVKGGPIVRRAYFDRVLGRLFPARAGLSSEYGRALAQRNGALRRVRAGLSSKDAVEPWTVQAAALGTELDAAREELAAQLAPGFADRADALGLGSASLRYAASGITVEGLEARFERDLERAVTGLGPHLVDVVVEAGARDLRSFGSQGEQRAAVLALVLAEAALLAERRGDPPLLLLDDVLSELDERRRLSLREALPPGGQTLITATERSIFPGEPALVVAVSPGEARAA